MRRAKKWASKADARSSAGPAFVPEHRDGRGPYFGLPRPGAVPAGALVRIVAFG